MLIALINPSFQRAFRSGRFGTQRDLRRAAMLSEREFIDRVHKMKPQMAYISILPHRGLVGEIYARRENESSMERLMDSAMQLLEEQIPAPIAIGPEMQPSECLICGRRHGREIAHKEKK
jgi:hypothetical protein